MNVGYYGSLFFYVLLGIIICTLARNIERTENRGSTWRKIIILIILLSIFPALRSETTGIDTALYMPRFEQILAGGNAQTLYGWNKGLAIIVQLVLNTFKNAQWVLVLGAFVTNTLIIFRLYELRLTTSFSYTILIYYCIYYFYEYNIFRQMLAVSIIFYAVRYISYKKYIHYGILLFIACQIHVSALLGIVYIGINLLCWKQVSIKRLLFIGCTLVLLPVTIVVAYNIAATKILYYFYATEYHVGALMLIKIVLLCMNKMFHISIKVGRIATCHVVSVDSTPEEGIASEKALNIIYALGLLGSSAGYIFPYMDRLGLYFMLYEGIYWGREYKKNSRGLFAILFAGLALIMFVLSIVSSEQGQTPFSFYINQ